VKPLSGAPDPVDPADPVDGLPSVADAPRPSIVAALEARPALRGVAWMTLASALFAVMNVAARVASAHVPWPEVAASRALVGALVAFSLARARGARLRVGDRRASWYRSLFGTGALVCTFIALAARQVPLGDVVTLASTSPIFIALLSPWLLGERVGRRVALATPLAFAGVCVVLQPTFHLAAGVALVTTAAAVLSALAMIWLRRLGPDESSEAIVVHFSLTAASVTALLSIPVFRLPDLRGALALAATGVTGGLAQVSMTRAYALDRAARIGAVGYLGVVFTQVLAVAWLGETPAPSQAIGSALVIGAGLLLAEGAWRERRA
jgi:drug/metabolite transporter (DMT)-like permease